MMKVSRVRVRVRQDYGNKLLGMKMLGYEMSVSRTARL